MKANSYFSNLVVGLILIVSANSQAFLDPQEMETMFKDQVQKKIKAQHRTRAADACADFSGKWSGTCSHKPDEIDRLEIQQSKCEFLTFLREGMPSFTHNNNGLVSHGSAAPKANAIGASTTAWDAEGSVFLMLSNYLATSPHMDGLLSIPMSGQLLKRGEDLVLYSKIFLPEGPLEITCRYQKVN